MHGVKGNKVRRRTLHPDYVELVNTWRTCSFKHPPFIFPGDSGLLDSASENYISILRSFDEYIRDKSFANRSDKTLHLGLLSAPYSGSLATASVFILLLNPGLSPLDYYSEEIRSVRTHQIKNLQQRLSGRYPFMSLNPKLSWRGGARYWLPKLDGHIRILMKNKKIDYFEALGHLSKSICVLQFVPYHSRAFGLPKRIIRGLASIAAMKKFVHEVLVPEAKRGKSLLIVTRRSKAWGIRQAKNIIIYRGSEPRAGSISPDSRGGKALIKFLNL